jgi:hypothetical protein
LFGKILQHAFEALEARGDSGVGVGVGFPPEGYAPGIVYRFL